MYPLGDRGGLCVAQHGSMVHLTGRSRVFIPCVPCAAKWPLVLWQPFARRVLGSMLRRCTASTPVASSFEWHHFVNRSALFTNSFRRHRDNVPAKQEAQCGFRQSIRSLFHVRTCWLPVEFTDGGGTTVPLSGGLVGFVALQCYAEECAFSLSTHAQDHVWDLAEYKQVEPAYFPTGATSGGTSCERNLLCAYHSHCLRTRLVLCKTGVLELDLT